MGSLTLTTVSELIQTAPASPTISAPALWYSASGKPDCAPAWVSTSTVCPASLSAFTPAGVTPTRASLSLISLGTQIFIAAPPVWLQCSWMQAEGRPVHPTRKKLDAPGCKLCFNVLGPNEQDCGQPETGDD